MKLFLTLACVFALSSSCLAAFKATTTNYDGDEGSCGGCKINLVHGVAGWAAAATPQSMQEPYECGACPTCACATGKYAHDAGKPAAGCGACFSATSTGTNLYGDSLPKVSFNIVVVDSCPYDDGNQEWCPKHVGDKNKHGYEYHFDLFIDDVNKLHLGDNPIITFNPISCPSNIVSIMNQKCCGIWWVDQGCPRKTSGGITYGNCNAGQYSCN